MWTKNRISTRNIKAALGQNVLNLPVNLEFTTTSLQNVPHFAAQSKLYTDLVSYKVHEEQVEASEKY